MLYKMTQTTLGAIISCIILANMVATDSYCSDITHFQELLIITGYTEDKPPYRPIIVFPDREKIFRSNIELNETNSPIVLFSQAHCQFIIITDDIFSSIHIYKEDISNNHLGKPVFTYKHNGDFQLKKGYWDNKYQTLYLCGLLRDKSGHTEDEIIKKITIVDNNIVTEDIHLRTNNSYAKDYFFIKNMVVVVGGKSSHTNKPYIVYDIIKQKIIHDELLISHEIIGTLNSENLAIEKDGRLYSYDFNKLLDIGPAYKKTILVYGFTKTKEGYFADYMTHFLFMADKPVLAIFPIKQPEKHKDLFFNTSPGSNLQINYLDFEKENELLALIGEIKQ